MFKRFFLTADAWQLCLLMVAPYAVYKFSNFGHHPISWGILAIYFLVVFLGWVYSVGISANQNLNEQFKISPLFFRIAVVVPFIYLPVFVFGFLMPLSEGRISRPPQGLMIVHFLALFAIGYSIWYAAKQYTTLRENRETGFIDYYPVFMGLWFCVIGVWFLQGKLSKTLADSKIADSTSAH